MKNKERELYEFMIDCILVYNKLPALYDNELKSLDKQHIKVLESIPSWTWNLAEVLERDYDVELHRHISQFN